MYRFRDDDDDGDDDTIARCSITGSDVSTEASVGVSASECASVRPHVGADQHGHRVHDPGSRDRDV